MFIRNGEKNGGIIGKLNKLCGRVNSNFMNKIQVLSIFGDHFTLTYSSNVPKRRD